MAERVAIPSDWLRTGGVVRLDPSRPIEAGALVEPLHTVVNGQDEARIGPDLAVLVQGLGPIGILHVALAAWRGARPVIGVDPDPARDAAAAAIVGNDHVRVMDDGWESAVRVPLDGGGFDVVVTATPARAAFGSAIELAEPGGRILAFAGLPAGASTIELDLNVVHYRQLSIVGAFGGGPASFRRAAEWLAATSFDVAAFAPIRFPLDAAPEAFLAVERGAGLKTLQTNPLPIIKA
jgi:L-iditol 2-dehydrogenase